MWTTWNPAAAMTLDTSDDPGLKKRLRFQERLRERFVMSELREHSTFSSMRRGPWAVFRVILDHLGDRPEAWPGMRRIGRQAGYTSLRSVAAFVHALEAGGFLCLRREHLSDGTERIFYSLGPSAFEALEAFETRWPRGNGPTVAPAKPRPALETVAPPPAMVSPPPPAGVAGKLRSPDLREPSSSSEDLPIWNGTAEKEEMDQTPVVETAETKEAVVREASTTANTPVEDAGVTAALHAILRTLNPTWLLATAPSLATYDADVVVKARAILQSLPPEGDATALFGEAAAGAMLKSKGQTTLRYVCKTSEHFIAHVDRKRAHDATEAKKATRAAQQARDEVFGVSTRIPPASASRASERRVEASVDAMRAAMQAAARERSKTGELFPGAIERKAS